MARQGNADRPADVGVGRQAGRTRGEEEAWGRSFPYLLPGRRGIEAAGPVLGGARSRGAENSGRDRRMIRLASSQARKMRSPGNFFPGRLRRDRNTQPPRRGNAGNYGVTAGIGCRTARSAWPRPGSLPKLGSDHGSAARFVPPAPAQARRPHRWSQSSQLYADHAHAAWPRSWPAWPGRGQRAVGCNWGLAPWRYSLPSRSGISRGERHWRQGREAPGRMDLGRKDLAGPGRLQGVSTKAAPEEGPACPGHAGPFVT
jgi:hypothetical protein